MDPRGIIRPIPVVHPLNTTLQCGPTKLPFAASGLVAQTDLSLMGKKATIQLVEAVVGFKHKQMSPSNAQSASHRRLWNRNRIAAAALPKIEVGAV